MMAVQREMCQKFPPLHHHHHHHFLFYPQNVTWPALKNLLRHPPGLLLFIDDFSLAVDRYTRAVCNSRCITRPGPANAEHVQLHLSAQLAPNHTIHQPPYFIFPLIIFLFYNLPF